MSNGPVAGNAKCVSGYINIEAVLTWSAGNASSTEGDETQIRIRHSRTSVPTPSDEAQDLC